MIGLPANGRMFLRRIRLLPPRAGMTATIMSRGEPQDLIDHGVLLRVGQCGVKRYRDGARVVRFGVGELTAPEAKLAEVGMGVDRNIMDLNANAGGAQAGKGIGAGYAERRLVPADHIEMPRRRAVGIAPRQR